MEKANQRSQKLNKIKTEVFTNKDAKKVGLSFYDLKLLIGSDKIQRSDRGIYRKESSEYDQNEDMVNILVHVGRPSCVSLLSALFVHNLTDMIPDQIWIYVPYGKFTHLRSVKVIRKRVPYWDIGIEMVGLLRITSIERTLIDCLVDRKHFDEVDAIGFVKQALNEERTTVAALFSMAKRLKVEKRVKLILTLMQESYV